MRHQETSPTWENLKWISNRMVAEGLAHWEQVPLQAPPIHLPADYFMGTHVPYLNSTNLNVTQRLWFLTGPGGAALRQA